MDYADVLVLISVVGCGVLLAFVLTWIIDWFIRGPW